MLDFDAGKLLIIGLVALVVIGPKDLPRVLRQVGQAVGKLRRMAGEFQGQFMDAMKEADLQDIKAELAKIKDTATLDVDFNPVRDIKEHVTGALNSETPSTPAADVALAPPTDGGFSGFELPPSVHAEMDATVGAGGVGPVTDIEPVMTADAAVHASEPAGEASESAGHVAEPAVQATEPALASTETVLETAEQSTAAPADRDAGTSTSRRKIVVTRRRRLSRLDGPTIRAAVLAGHSRNIRPARRDTTDP